MQLTHEDINTRYHIGAYEPGQISINETPYRRSVILTPDKLITDWPPQQVQELLLSHVDVLLNEKPEVILIGTGNIHLDIPAALLTAIYEKRIGVEVMATFAACKTFNLLAADGRRVVAGLFV